MFLEPKPMNTPRNRLTAAIRRTTRPAIRDFATIFLQEKKRKKSCKIVKFSPELLSWDVCRSSLRRPVMFASWDGS